MNTKKWYNSKTIWFNVLVSVLGIITALQGISELESFAVFFATILAVGNVLLRVWFTDSAVK